MTLCIVSWDGIPFSSPIYCLKKSSLNLAQYSISSQSSAFAGFANNTITTVSGNLYFTFHYCLLSSMIFIICKISSIFSIAFILL